MQLKFESEKEHKNKMKHMYGYSKLQTCVIT